MRLFSPLSTRRISSHAEQTQSESLDLGTDRPSTALSISTEATITDDMEDFEDVEALPEADAPSEASSVISTGTRMSYRTLPQPSIREPPNYATQTHSGPIDIVLGRRNFRITARPGSILSISSYDQPSSRSITSIQNPAPPYEVNAPGTESSSTLVQSIAEHEGDSSIQSQDSSDLAAPVPRRIAPIVNDGTVDELSPSSRPVTPPSPPLSPATRSANAISAHYKSVVRTIDTNHRAEIDQLKEYHAAELAQLQISLAETRNSMDAAYRNVYKDVRAKAEADTGILKAQVQQLEAELAALRVEMIAHRDEAVRKAKHEVEDVWEGRWRDRMRIAGEEVGAAFDEREKVATCWESEVKARWPAVVDDVRAAVERSMKKEKVEERRARKSSGSSGSFKAQLHPL